MRLDLSKLQFSLSDTHPNKMLITGAITKVGEASTAAPYGANGKRVVFTKEGAEACCKSYVSMPINCTFPDWLFGDGTDVFTGHGDTCIGTIEDAWVEDNDLMARIVIWKDRFPDIGFMICNGKDALGFSVECDIDEEHSDDAQDGFMYIDRFTGTGCALLWKNVAAFEDTYIKELVASRRKVVDRVDEKKMQEMLDAMAVKFSEQVAGVQASFAELKAKAEENEKLSAEVADLKAKADETEEALKAAKDGEVKPPAPKTGQTVVGNDDLVPADDKQTQFAKVYASDVDMVEKLREIAKINAKKSAAE